MGHSLSYRISEGYASICTPPIRVFRRLPSLALTHSTISEQQYES